MYGLQEADRLRHSIGHHWARSASTNSIRRPAQFRGVATWEHKSIMQRLRSTWLALVGGAFLVTLSISAAFGASPQDSTDGTRGQTVASFVHEVVFGADEDADEELTEPETDQDLDEDLDEEDGNEDVDEDLDEDADEDLDEDPQVNEDANAHGECVSEIAKTKPEADSEENHGTVVSEAARETCWESGAADEDLTEDEAAEGDADTETVTTKEERQAERAAAKAERTATQAAAKAERSDARDAVKAERSNGGGKP